MFVIKAALFNKISSVEHNYFHIKFPLKITLINPSLLGGCRDSGGGGDSELWLGPCWDTPRSGVQLLKHLIYRLDPWKALWVAGSLVSTERSMESLEACG